MKKREKIGAMIQAERKRSEIRIRDQRTEIRDQIGLGAGIHVDMIGTEYIATIIIASISPSILYLEVQKYLTLLYGFISISRDCLSFVMDEYHYNINLQTSMLS